VILAHALLAALLVAGAAGDGDNSTPQPPRLVILVVVDQCRRDYLDRFAPRFEGFFARLHDEGRTFVEGEQHHAITVTAAGHATLGTGRFPSRHGIVGNDFFDAATNRMVGAANDAAALPVGALGGGYSAARLECDALGDWWKRRWPLSRAIGISIKPRSAILPLGRGADEAWWVDERSGALVTSDAFVKELPAWAAAFDAQPPIDGYPQAWEATLPDAAAYAELGCTGDDAPGEARSGTNRSRSFPHSLAAVRTADRVNALLFSPWGDELLLDFARAAIEGEALGADDVPDLLVLALSGTDYIGHRHGPDSWEICEQLLHLDRALADFLSFAEAKIGADRLLLAFSSDHGVAPLPEVAAARGQPGGRVDWPALQPKVEEALRSIAPELEKAALPISEFGIRLDRAALARSGRSVLEVAPALAAKLRASPPFVDARSHVELAGVLDPGDRYGELLRRSSDGERAGDLLFVLAPGTIYVPPPLRVEQAAALLATSHGSLHDYDTAVPIVFLGVGVQAGRIAGRAWTVDVAPTLALAAGVPFPADLDGKPLPLADVH